MVDTHFGSANPAHAHHTFTDPARVLRLPSAPGSAGDGLYDQCAQWLHPHTGADMSAEPPGKSAAWAKVLAALVFLVLMPLVIWFLVSFPKSGAFPW
ncbi:hypothetical protein [Streptomyces pseudogriseolus]|uniref:hypothetical protein n=1 Tax=Streptomyces pseudogriseolus TaxID=36817 RepID=UPI003489F8C3